MDKIPELKSLLNDGEQIPIRNYPKPSGGSNVKEFSSQDILIYKRLDFSRIDTFITPVESFFIRNHLNYPDADVSDWRLKLEGCFRNECMLSMEEIKKFEQMTKVFHVECTGNQRSEKTIIDKFKILYRYSSILSLNKLMKMLDPMQWKWTLSVLRADGIRGGNLISNGVFTGVRLFDVLKKYPLTDNAKEIVFEGMDKGHDTMMQRLGKTNINYARSFEIEELKIYDPILCFEMNGNPLRIEHGFPLRLIIPGMYGGEQIKWLGRIIATSEKYRGYYQTEYYGYKINGETVPVHEVRPKAVVIKVLKKNMEITAYGVAWRGLSPLDRIEVSVDNMNTWDPASLLCREIDNSWIFWKYEIPQRMKGVVTIIPRAFCVNGDCQPLKPDEYSSAYGNNAVVSAVVKI